MNEPFRYRFRVRYNECDAQRVVFNARYADYVDLAMTEFMRALGCGYTELLARGLDNQVVRLTLDWRAPAHFDEVLEARVTVARLGRTSFELGHEIVHADDRRTLCTATAVYVLMTTDPFAKTPLPEDLRTALDGGARDRVIDQSGRG
ncbi:4-hydroxybenzoyl-CoA thioesterase [Salinisphaera orenii MK-B5]|uniref:4-hydroxybenzoyl-CoA thioesterase n=1 Tax=Salinisphaera orenii MK-B5 TaxID=856730 RepID=A0A423PKH9_9GAMM|nr:thioesterase family protein [Salinisphaera orenii]ROO26022.1 4-hydroxybenzoyl-CoA thioesterase [Salinisphaera orenii MK-B5]